MQSIDVTDVNDVTLKRDFFSVLPQAIPQFPRVTITCLYPHSTCHVGQLISLVLVELAG